jgi:hypothetical protein
VTLGRWLCSSENQGIEAVYFDLGNRTSSFFASSTATPILARPVFDTDANAEAAMLVAHPDFLTGSIAVDASTELYGLEALFRQRLYDCCEARLDLLLGYRFASLDESLRISQSSLFTAAQGPIVAGTQQELFDLFNTQNRFHGGELGLEYRQQICCWWLDVVSKVAFGSNRAEVLINGETVTTVPGAGSATFVGGLLAQQTNIGTYERDTFGVIPELSVTLVRDLSDNLRFSIGYNVFYWSMTHRPGDQIDREVSQFPPEPPTGTLQPAFNFQASGYLAQGLQVGLEYQY